MNYFKLVKHRPPSEFFTNHLSNSVLVGLGELQLGPHVLPPFVLPPVPRINARVLFGPPELLSLPPVVEFVVLRVENILAAIGLEIGDFVAKDGELGDAHIVLVREQRGLSRVVAEPNARKGVRVEVEVVLVLDQTALDLLEAFAHNVVADNGFERAVVCVNAV
jgi:hypothetical protein